MSDIILIDIGAERESFERFCRRGLSPGDSDTFLARNLGGGYVMLTATAGWAAWQYRATMRALEEGIAELETSGLRPDSPAAVLRKIQMLAGGALALLKEGTPGWELVADIHKLAASALTLKPAQPEAST